MKKANVDNILRMFIARNTIKWDKPIVTNELNSYFGCPETNATFLKHGLHFIDGCELRKFLAKGKLMPFSDNLLAKVGNFASASKDLEEKLNDQTYSQAYKELERKMEKGNLLLEAPIIVQFKDDSYWCFSGRKRAYAARKQGIPVLYFLVKQPQDEEKDDLVEDKEDAREDEMESNFLPKQLS